MTEEDQGLEAFEITTETEAAAALAGKPVVVKESNTNDHRLIVALPPAWVLQTDDLERFAIEPERHKGTITVTDAASFITAVQDRRDQGHDTTIYADSSQARLVAVMNDDHGTSVGWRDYRVSLGLIRTPQWTHWLAKDGKLMSQDEFAEHIENGLVELTAPPAADMLDLAQTFHATNQAKFKSGRRLGSGETQFMYEEDLQATAGTSGTLSIPTQLELNVAPFYGAREAFVQAWFRFRLNGGALTLGYKLDRPYEVEQRAFEEIRDEVKGGLQDLTCLSGPAPDPRS